LIGAAVQAHASSNFNGERKSEHGGMRFNYSLAGWGQRRVSLLFPQLRRCKHRIRRCRADVVGLTRRLWTTRRLTNGDERCLWRSRLPPVAVGASITLQLNVNQSASKAGFI
jgi:hypothetical protein